MDTLTSAKVGIIPESTKYIPVFFTKAGKTPCINDKMVHSVIPEVACQSGSCRTVPEFSRFFLSKNSLKSLEKTRKLLNFAEAR